MQPAMMLVRIALRHRAADALGVQSSISASQTPCPIMQPRNASDSVDRLLGHYTHYLDQFSTLRPLTRLNSSVLLVTSVSSRERACAAMKRSFAPIIVPHALSTARI